MNNTSPLSFFPTHHIGEVSHEGKGQEQAQETAQTGLVQFLHAAAVKLGVEPPLELLPALGPTRLLHPLELCC